MSDQPTLPTPEDRALVYLQTYMADQPSHVPTDLVRAYVVDHVAKELDQGSTADDPKVRAEKAFTAVDRTERARANEAMRSRQAAFSLGEHDLIVALAGRDEDEAGNFVRYTTKHTARCRVGAINLEDYLRWDFIQDANRRNVNEAYDRAKARFAPYLPWLQRGLTIQEIDERGLIDPNGTTDE